MSQQLGPRGRGRALVGLCVTELASWGSLYYTVPATLPTLVEQTGWSSTQIMTGFTAGLLLNALAAVPVGRIVDRHGPRWVMTSGSLLGATALVAVGTASDPRWFAAAWMLAGLAQACVLYPPAFAALTRWYGPDRVRPLTVLALTAGLASTVFAPISAELTTELGGDRPTSYSRRCCSSSQLRSTWSPSTCPGRPRLLSIGPGTLGMSVRSLPPERSGYSLSASP